MGQKNHEAKLKYWSQFTAEQKSKIFSDRAKKMWANKTLKQKKTRSVLMHMAKNSKNANISKKQRTISSGV